MQSCGGQRELDEKPELEESQCGLFRGREKEKQGVGRRGRKTERGALRLMQMGGCSWWGRPSPGGAGRPRGGFRSVRAGRKMGTCLRVSH